MPTFVDPARPFFVEVEREEYDALRARLAQVEGERDGLKSAIKANCNFCDYQNDCGECIFAEALAKLEAHDGK